jgi:hypothetical protein
MKYHANWSFFEVYSLPIKVREWFLQRLTKQIESENEEYRKAQNKPT